MIVLPDISRTDGTAHNLCQRIKTDVPILLISMNEKLNLNEEVFRLKGKKYIVIDYVENGWNWDRQSSFILGRMDPNVYKDEGWSRLNEFIADNKPYLYFKRELLESDNQQNIYPIEYPNWQPVYETQSKEEFNSRRISVMNYWGRSHEARLMLHGEIWKHAARKGYAVCDNLYYYNNFMNEETNPNIWLTFWIPHYNRIDISQILNVNGMSKLSVSLPGCGVKCFRSTGESIVNSVAVMPEDNLAYSYPFIHNVNCIKFPIESVDGISKEWKVCEAIEEALRNPNLYDIYLESLKAAKWYQVDNYVSHLESLINKA